MDDDLVPVLIVGIIFAFVSYKTYLSHRTKQMELQVELAGGADLEEVENLRARVAGQEKRIQVLESIVTSKDFKLTEEIDSLP